MAIAPSADRIVIRSVLPATDAEAGQSFPLVLEFEKAGELRVEVAVIAPAAAAPGASAPPST